MALQQDKYRQAILYFLHECDNQHLGVVKLMKLLYFLDFDHFERHRSAVTRDVYRRLPRGPVPARAKDILDDLVLDGEIVPRTVEVGDYEQFRYDPQVPYDLSVFTDDERAVLRSVADRWRNASSTAIEQATHAELPWIVTAPYATIPYRLAFHRKRDRRLSPLDRDDMIHSAIGSQSLEGVELSYEEAATLLDEVLKEPVAGIDW
jgi:uncharacterized phage-associated protein